MMADNDTDTFFCVSSIPDAIMTDTNTRYILFTSYNFIYCITKDAQGFFKLFIVTF